MAPVKIRAGIIVYVRGGGFFIHIASAGLVFFNIVSINICTRGQKDISLNALKKGGREVGGQDYKVSAFTKYFSSTFLCRRLMSKIHTITPFENPSPA